jgi:hypothetical protein
MLHRRAKIHPPATTQERTFSIIGRTSYNDVRETLASRLCVCPVRQEAEVLRYEALKRISDLDEQSAELRTAATESIENVSQYHHKRSEAIAAASEAWTQLVEAVLTDSVDLDMKSNFVKQMREEGPKSRIGRR